jgi:predicted RNA polymerase sigma factor
MSGPRVSEEHQGELSQTVGLLERVVAQCRDWDITSHTPIALARWGTCYDLLLQMEPSPVIRLNRAVAVAMRDGPAAGLP